MNLNISNNYFRSSKPEGAFKDLVMNSENKVCMHTHLIAPILKKQKIKNKQTKHYANCEALFGERIKC